MKPENIDRVWKRDRDELVSAVLEEIGEFADEKDRAGLGRALGALAQMPVEAPSSELVSRAKSLKHAYRPRRSINLLGFGKLAAAAVVVFVMALALITPTSGPIEPGASWDIPQVAKVSLAGAEPVEMSTLHTLCFDKDALVSFRSNEIALFAGSKLGFVNQGLSIRGSAALKTAEKLDVIVKNYAIELEPASSAHVAESVATLIEGNAAIVQGRDRIAIDATESPREVLFLEKPIVMRAESKSLASLGARLKGVGISTRLETAGTQKIVVTHYEKKSRMGRAELVSRMEGYIGNGTVAFKLKTGTVGLKEGDNVANWRVESIADRSITLVSDAGKLVLPLK